MCNVPDRYLIPEDDLRWAHDLFDRSGLRASGSGPRRGGFYNSTLYAEPAVGA